MVTCPYLRELDTIAYFALLRRRHSYRAVAAIRDTTQLLLDVHRHEGALYVHPLKVFQRYSPTMYLPHVWQGDSFRPVTESATISGIYETLTRDGAGTRDRPLRPLGPHVPGGAGDGRGRAARRAPAGGDAGDFPASAAHGDQPQRAHAGTGRALPDHRGTAGRAPPHDRHRPARREVDGHAAWRGRSCGARTSAGRTSSSRTIRSSSAPTSSILTWSKTAAGGSRQKQRDSERFLDGVEQARSRCWPARSRSSCATSSPRCSTTSASRRSSCARPACWKTTTATPSPASTRASSAPTRARRRSGWWRSCRR